MGFRVQSPSQQRFNYRRDIEPESSSSAADDDNYSTAHASARFRGDDAETISLARPHAVAQC